MSMEKYIETNRGRVYYWIDYVPRDKCIFFAHGITFDHNLFNGQIKEFSRDYTVIAWDMPLHGKSITYEDFSLVHGAEDIKAILEREGISHTVLAGQSAGGYICQMFIDKYPAMVDAFIAIDSSPLAPEYYSAMDLFWVKHYSDIAKLCPFTVYSKTAAWVANCNERAREAFYKVLTCLGKEGMITATEEVFTDLCESMKKVRFHCPVLIILGSEDMVGFISSASKEWNEKTGFPLVEIEGAGHNANQDEPEEFNQVVKRFLSAIL